MRAAVLWPLLRRRRCADLLAKGENVSAFAGSRSYSHDDERGSIPRTNRQHPNVGRHAAIGAGSVAAIDPATHHDRAPGIAKPLHPAEDCGRSVLEPLGDADDDRLLLARIKLDRLALQDGRRRALLGIAWAGICRRRRMTASFRWRAGPGRWNVCKVVGRILGLARWKAAKRSKGGREPHPSTHVLPFQGGASAANPGCTTPHTPATMPARCAQGETEAPWSPNDHNPRWNKSI